MNKANKKPKVQPHSVNRIACNRCKELLAKIYPYAFFRTDTVGILCGKCINNDGTLKT